MTSRRYARKRLAEGPLRRRLRERLKGVETADVGPSRPNPVREPSARSSNREHKMDPRSRLNERERTYAQRMRTVRLIGEISLSREEFDSLTQELRDYRFWTPSRDIIGNLKRDFPATLAVFLVYCGVYNYEAGDYWGSVCAHLRICKASTESELGQFFEEFIRSSNLETFDRFPAKALRYVSRILAHGGIPDYCLPDFFELLQYTLQRPDWVALPPPTLIDEWRARNYSFIPVDVPVWRFLNHGGSVAHDFLQRALDMAASAFRTKDVPPADISGLPQRIVDRFRDWLSKKPATSVGRSTRLSAPRLIFDPWARDGLTIELPAETILASSSSAEWIVQAGSEQAVVRTRVTGSSDKRKTQSESVRLRSPASRYNVVLRIDGRDYGTWHLPGISSDRPLMVFEPNTGQAISWSGQLPARDVWLVTNDRQPELVDGTGRTVPAPVIEEFPSMMAGWAGFTPIHVDLAGGSQLLLHTSSLPVQGRPSSEASPVTIPIKADEAAARARLITDGLTVRGVTATDDQLSVLAMPPIVEIPVPQEDRGSAFRPELWTIVISSQSGAVPTNTIAEKVTNLAWSRSEDGHTQVPLCQRRMLPDSALGTFVVAVHGPLGQDASFVFAIVPGLDIRGREDPLRVQARDGRTATFQLSTICPVHLGVVDSSTNVRGGPSSYELETTNADVVVTVTPDLSHPLGVGDGSPLELTISVPILRWALLGFGGRQSVSWSTSPIMVSRSELDAALEPAVLLEGYTVKDRVSRKKNYGTVRLTLRTPDREPIQVVHEPIRNQRIWISLLRFADSIRARADAALEFAIDVWDEAERHVLVDVAVLRVTQSLTVEHFTIVEETLKYAPEAQREFTVRWIQQFPVTNRVLRIWSLTRPWERPIRIPIPDNVDTVFSFTVPLHQMPPGRYRFGMQIVDPWMLSPADLTRLPLHPSDTSGEERGLLDAEVGREEEIRQYLAMPPADASALIEKALISRNADILAGLPALLAQEEDLEVPLRVLEHLLEIEDREPTSDGRSLAVIIADLQDALRVHPQLFASLVGALDSAVASSGTSDERSMRRRAIALIAALGIPQMSPQKVLAGLQRLPESGKSRLEQVFPPLLSAAIDHDPREIVSQQTDAEALLGRTGLHLLIPELAQDENELANGWLSYTDAQWQRIIEAFARSVHPRDYNLSAEQLRGIRNILGIIPQGILDTDAFDLATFDWLIPLRDSMNQGLAARIDTWLENTVPQLVISIGKLDDYLSQHRSAECGLSLARTILGKRVQRSYEGVAFLPFAVGMTALAQRLIARRPRLAGELGFLPSTTNSWGRAAAQFAPELYVRDLCLIDLLLLRSSMRAESNDQDA